MLGRRCRCFGSGATRGLWRRAWRVRSGVENLRRREWSKVGEQVRALMRYLSGKRPLSHVSPSFHHRVRLEESGNLTHLLKSSTRYEVTERLISTSTFALSAAK